MAAMHTDFECGPVNLRVRSLSHASHPGLSSPTDSPMSLSPAAVTRSPSVASPPTNTPESEFDSQLASPSGRTPQFQFHPPDFLKPHHFHSPLLWPTAPPNSPENWRINGETMSTNEEDVSTSLGERLAALHMARPNKGGFSDAEVKILKNETPKAPDNALYEIRAIPGKGYGCFAKEPIKLGTRILADDPLLTVHVAAYYESHIKEAFSKLSPDDQALYFTLHSAHGQDPDNWPKHVHPALDSHEKCRIEEQHKARVAKEPSLISIFQTNCMEWEHGAAVFPHAARFNHSCNPNACFAWNPAIKKEIIHAMRDIEKDEQITLAYTDMTHDRGTRRWELKHYGFVCDCPACNGDDCDPESFAGKSAERRFRLEELEHLFTGMRGRYLEYGLQQEDFVGKLLEYVKLLKEEGQYTVQLANAYRDISQACERYGDFPAAKKSALTALKIKLDCHGPDFPDVKKYTEVVQRIKRKMESQASQEGPGPK